MAKKEELDELIETEEVTDEADIYEHDSEERDSHSSYIVPKDPALRHHLGGMYQNWFLDYASYVILERAVPHIDDGLKPVQRRILHSMERLDDGRYNKVANIIGHTMQFHPHGDASIGDALVQLGQKDLLIDCQGNWGNILTGDSAAASRYIEARLSKFAIDVMFNHKITDWRLSYDGRNKEPINLPAKFPLLLAQGVEGIAVGLSSKILPHNFNELLDASIAYLNGEKFHLLPDFQTGGMIDAAKYNDGERGGSVKVRAKIEKRDSKTLAITQLPFGRNTGSLIDSILKANETGKIKIKKIDDNTAKDVEILIHLLPNTSSDKTIDALFAFTDCEISISPNCCIIEDNKPGFLNISTVLRHNTDQTVRLLRRELEIERSEILERLHFSSLEKIFIEERIYKEEGYEKSKSIDEAITFIDFKLEPFKPSFIREVVREDIQKLLEIKMARILKFNTDRAEELIREMKKKVKEIEINIKNIIPFTIKWFEYLKNKYGKNYPRRTEIRSFGTIEATKVVEANEKLYINREEGFIGTGLKKDEFVCHCSDIDDIAIFYKDGRYKIVKVTEKLFVDKGVIHLDVFKKNDKRTIYNVVYRDGKHGSYYIKRFFITGLTRDKEYDVTQGKAGSKIVYFTANPNGEAETIKIILKPHPRLRRVSFEQDFSTLGIKGKQAQGNLVTKNEVSKVLLKSKGGSTLGGRKVWFDQDILRLNYDDHGMFLGEFFADDHILVVLNNGEYYTTTFELTNNFEENIAIIEKFKTDKIWTVALYDAEQGFYYLKRFNFEASRNRQSYIGDNPKSHQLLLTDTFYPRLEVTFGGKDSFREKLEIDADEFIGIKSFRAKGKRIATYSIETIIELEPTRYPESTEEEEDLLDENEQSNDPMLDLTDQQILDELSGISSLFEE